MVNMLVLDKKFKSLQDYVSGQKFICFAVTMFNFGFSLQTVRIFYFSYMFMSLLLYIAIGGCLHLDDLSFTTPQ